ncbi:MAG TPA: hypothetical protein VFM76_04590 [Methylophaga sp.]|nr:hypothetical protein [Methylophaga sp.]
MQYSICQLVANKIAKGWQAGLSVFLLLNLALLQAVALPIPANHSAPTLSNEIKSAGPSLQRDLPRINLHIGSETASGNNDDLPADTFLSTSILPHFNKAETESFFRPDAVQGNGRYDYFLPEPRAAPQA